MATDCTGCLHLISSGYYGALADYPIAARHALTLDLVRSVNPEYHSPTQAVAQLVWRNQAEQSTPAPVHRRLLDAVIVPLSIISDRQPEQARSPTSA